MSANEATAPATHQPVEVLALTKYGRLAASSRCRFLNYIPFLAARNISVTVAPLLSDDYVRRRLTGARVDYVEIARAYVSRLWTLVRSHRYDVLWIEGELLPRMPASATRLLARLKRPIVIDMDDAIFHNYDLNSNFLIRSLLRRKIDVVFNRATAVVVGNEYLAERARNAGARNVLKVPTGVDHEAYAGRAREPSDRLTFGWIGSTFTAPYLNGILPELEDLCGDFGARVRMIGVARHNFTRTEVDLRPWSEETEIDDLSACDIGLAPLSDGPWERGKCGLKAIQYMAVGMPVLAADVGILPEIVRHGETGFVYRDRKEFARYARTLAEDARLREKMGTAGKALVAERYSIRNWSDEIAKVLAEASASVGHANGAPAAGLGHGFDPACD